MAKQTINKSRVNRSLGGDIMVTLMLVLVGAFMILPLYLSVINAFKPLDEIFIYPPRFYVMKPTLTNFKQLFQMTSNLWVPFSRYVFNSVFVTVVVTVMHVILASMAAYPLAKHKFPGNKGIFTFVRTALLFTGGTIALPQYIIMAFLGMVDTYWALILPSVASALGLFLMKQFMEPIGDAMLEAAKIDGASEWRIWWQIVMPIVKPAWLTLAIFAFQSIWNATGGNFIYSEQYKLLPTVLTQIQAGGIARTGVAAAASLVMLVPPVLFFVITQSNVLETMAHSGMKD